MDKDQLIAEWFNRYTVPGGETPSDLLYNARWSGYTLAMFARDNRCEISQQDMERWLARNGVQSRGLFVKRYPLGLTAHRQAA